MSKFITDCLKANEGLQRYASEGFSITVNTFDKYIYTLLPIKGGTGYYSSGQDLYGMLLLTEAYLIKTVDGDWLRAGDDIFDHRDGFLITQNKIAKAPNKWGASYLGFFVAEFDSLESAQLFAQNASKLIDGDKWIHDEAAGEVVNTENNKRLKTVFHNIPYTTTCRSILHG